jgi:hypothetical protein
MRWFIHRPVLPFRFACSSISLLAVRAESRRSWKRSQVGRFVLAGEDFAPTLEFPEIAEAMELVAAIKAAGAQL